jgi:hypothetical protein
MQVERGRQEEEVVPVTRKKGLKRGEIVLIVKDNDTDLQRMGGTTREGIET